MLLASVAEIRGSLGFDDDMQNATDAITAALHAAEPALAAFLNTHFVRDVVVDTYYVPNPTLMDGPMLLTEFRLSQGMVAEVTEAILDISPEWGESTDISAGLIVKSDRGVVADTMSNFLQNFVRFTYTKGFEPDDTDANSYKLSQVPRWLQEAAKTQAMITLESHPALEQAGIKQDPRALRNQLSMILAPQRRYAPTALLPI
jgi:hypothetical protein